VAVSGTSAGGCLAAALTLVNRDRARHPLRLQILEVPVVDLTGHSVDLAPTRAVGIPSVIALREMLSVRRTYLGRISRAREPYASPLRAQSHAGLPPAVILTAEYDPLRREGAAYAAALRAAGVEASAVQYLGVTHDVPIFTGVLAAARRWEDEVVRALRSL
jgi:acetyl esterase